MYILSLFINNFVATQIDIDQPAKENWQKNNWITVKTSRANRGIRLKPVLY